MTETKERLEGTVCWFDVKRGFGFIKGDNQEKDHFVHWQNVKMEGFKALEKDQRVSYELGSNDKGVQAVNVELIK